MMAVGPMASSEQDSPRTAASCGNIDSRYFMRVIAAGSLAASGVLLMSGKRRAGLVVAAVGTALSLIDQQEVVREYWNRLPGFLEEVQNVLTRVQGAVEELSAQNERLRTVLSK